ncbi:MAG: hypothetical protein QXR58_01940, partial [Candidatus Micrarchaeaceae archaeon]
MAGQKRRRAVRAGARASSSRAPRGAKPKISESETEETGQSAMEYLITYGWAVLLIAIIASLLYLYLAVPHIIVSSTCSFVSGAYCNDLVVGAN